MGCYDIVCMECGEEHIGGGDVCNVVICGLVWKREGAPDLRVPRCLKATYGGYGDFEPVDATLTGKIALFDADTVSARDLEDLLSSVPETTDYIFSVVAAAESCEEAEEADEEEEEEPAAEGGGA